VLRSQIEREQFDVAKKTDDVAPSLSQEQNFAKWDKELAEF
jgi:hypothetical protein